MNSTLSSSPVKAISSPLSTVISILPHLLSSEPDLVPIRLSQPVLQRLRWITPQPDDVSYIYFNNMAGHGDGSRIEDLRMKLALLGPSSWRVCSEGEVEYKTDCSSPEPSHEQLRAAEVFSRVTIWDDGANENLNAPVEEKIALILKLEFAEEKSSGLPDFEWTYFDLQDLITPGLDRRPWFSSLDSAIGANFSAITSSKNKSHQSGSKKTGNPGHQNYSDTSSLENADDYWDGVSSSDESIKASSHALSSRTPHPSSSVLGAHGIGASTSSTFAKSSNSLASPSHPAYSKGSFLQDQFNAESPRKSQLKCDISPTDGLPAIDIEGLLEAAGIANLPSDLKEAAKRAFTHTNVSDRGTSHVDNRTTTQAEAVDNDPPLAQTRRRLEATLARAPRPLLEFTVESQEYIPEGTSTGRSERRASLDHQLISVSSSDYLKPHLETCMRGLYLMYRDSLRSSPQFVSQAPAEIDSHIRKEFVELARGVADIE